MNLKMDHLPSEPYTSGCQRARVVTEQWGANNLFCVACASNKLTRSPCNTRAVDFACDSCRATYQLKSGARWSERRIPDAGYEAMMAAIQADHTPNLIVLQYSQNWLVKNVLLVPSFFFVPSAVEKRPPLSPMARRAGWVGCNILLNAIAPEGKLRIVTNGNIEPRADIRAQYARLRPVATIPVRVRGWTLDVLRAVHAIGKPVFEIADVYGAEANLARLHPNNRHIRAKIRQQLQLLRDLCLLTFLGNGSYSLVPSANHNSRG